MRTNLLLSRFSKCSYAVKLVLFKAYSSTVLAGAPAEPLAVGVECRRQAGFLSKEV